MNSIAINRGFLGASKALWRDPRTWLLLLAVTEKSIFRYMMLVLTMVTGIEDIGVVMMHLAYIVLIAACLKRGSSFRVGDIMIMLFVVLSIVITWMIYPDNIDKYMIGEGQFWPTVFPLFRFFIVGLFLIPNDGTIELAGKVSCISVFVEALFFMFVLREGDMMEEEDMSRSYALLLSVLFTINYAFDKKRFWGILFSIVGTLLLLSLGTRGPIMILLAFIVVKILQSSTNKGSGYFLIIVLLLLMWFVNSPYWDLSLIFFQDIISSLGFSTRVIDLTIQGETLTHYSERDEIFALLISKIKENPITGWGVYGEWQFVGWSAHNIYLEILDNFGVILGGLIILLMVFIAIKAFLTSKATPVRGLVLLFACNVFVRGVFGGSFLTAPTFFMIGFCLQVCRKTNFKYLP